jgi:hypothetical protein
MKVMEENHCSFYTSALYEDESSVSRSGGFTLMYSLIRKLGEPQSLVWHESEEKFLPLQDIQPLPFNSKSFVMVNIMKRI